MSKTAALDSCNQLVWVVKTVCTLSSNRVQFCAAIEEKVSSNGTMTKSSKALLLTEPEM